MQVELRTHQLKFWGNGLRSARCGKRGGTSEGVCGTTLRQRPRTMVRALTIR